MKEDTNVPQKKKVTALVLSQTTIATDIYDMWIETKLAQDALPGQFVCIYPKDKSTLLPRPISICEVDKNTNKIRIVYRIAGKGTLEFSQYKRGDNIEILGTLGNGFPISEVSIDQNVILIAGGIGIPPMLELSKQVNGNQSIVLGYRNQQLFLKEELEKNGKVYIATEDGSVGTKGNVMDAISEHNVEGTIIFACGPMPMLRAIKQYAQVHKIKAYLSLEERMACGVGACLGCVCKTGKKDHHSNVNNTRICTDGPVFLADDVLI